MENRIAKLKEEEIVSNEDDLKTKKTEIEQECVSKNTFLTLTPAKKRLKLKKLSTTSCFYNLSTILLLSFIIWRLILGKLHTLHRIFINCICKIFLQKRARSKTPFGRLMLKINSNRKKNIVEQLFNYFANESVGLLRNKWQNEFRIFSYHNYYYLRTATLSIYNLN